MFNEENVFNEHFKCPHCKKIFADPRSLECGESLCNDCIMQLLSKQNGINCKICGELHKMPEKGFTKNLYLARMVDIMTIKRSQSVNDIHGIINMGNLKGHCDILRTDVSRIIEMCHSNFIQDEREFMKQINMFEKECMDKLDSRYSQYVSIAEFSVESSLAYDKCLEYLKTFKLNDCELSQVMNDVEKFKANIEKIFNLEKNSRR